MDYGVAFFFSVSTYVVYEFSKFFMIVALYAINKVASFRSWRDTTQRDCMFYGLSILLGCALYPALSFAYEYFENLNYVVAAVPGFIIFLGILNAVRKFESNILRHDAMMIYLDHGDGKFEKSICH